MKKVFIVVCIFLILTPVVAAGFFGDLFENFIENTGASILDLLKSKKVKSSIINIKSVNKETAISNNQIQNKNQGIKSFKKTIDKNRIQILNYKDNPSYRYLEDKDWDTIYRRPKIFRTKEENEKLENAVKVYPYPVVQAGLDYEFEKLTDTVLHEELISAEPTKLLSMFTPTQIGIKGMGVFASVDYSKKNHDKLIVGIENGGIYLSIDNGNSWTQLTNFPYYNVDRLVIDPQNDNHFFATAFGNELYESYDNGLTWNLNTKIDNEGCYPGDVDLIYWGDTNIFFRCQKDVAISNDGGQSWSKFGLTIGGTNARILRAKIKNTGMGLIAINDGAYVALYLTNDGGYTWNVILDSSNFLRYGDYIATYDLYDDGNYIVATIENGDPFLSQKIAKSYDQGQNWGFVDIEDSVKYDLEGNLIPHLGRALYPFAGGAQDLILDKTNQDRIFVFGYMIGLLESIDGGSNFERRYLSYENLFVFPIAEEVTPDNSQSEWIIIPLDLRFQHMIEIDNSIYMPTDQGLFSFDLTTKHLKNLDVDHHISQTIGVRVTSCPRIYTGLWHVGHYWINPDGSIEGGGGENPGASPGEDIGCLTEAFIQNSYFVDGIKSYYPLPSDQSIIDEEGQPITLTEIMNYHSKSKYYNGWHYLIGSRNRNQNLYRFKFDKIEPFPGAGVSYKYTLELVQHPGEGWPIEFTIDETSSTPYKLLDNELKYWSSSDLNNWQLENDFNHLNNLQNLNNGFQLGDLNIKMFVKGTQIILSGIEGLFISNNNGQTWSLSFPYVRSSNIVEDLCGWIYVGTFPLYSPSNLPIPNNVDKSDLTGLWVSKNNGLTWELHNNDVKKSFITGLDISEDYIYAATSGDGLWRVSSKCKSGQGINIVKAPLVSSKMDSEDELSLSEQQMPQEEIAPIPSNGLQSKLSKFFGNLL